MMTRQAQSINGSDPRASIHPCQVNAKYGNLQLGVDAKSDTNNNQTCRVEATKRSRSI